ncbi:hypothetical protein L9F63_001153, partial [Diploptera punctata]
CNACFVVSKTLNRGKIFPDQINKLKVSTKMSVYTTPYLTVINIRGLIGYVIRMVGSRSVMQKKSLVVRGRRMYLTIFILHFKILKSPAAVTMLLS